MNTVLDRVKALLLRIAKRPALLISVISILAVFVVLQIAFVSQLFAAELLFGAVFAVLVALVAIFYLIGVLAERGLNGTGAGVRMVARLAQCGLKAVSDISRRQFHHPHSQSVR